MIKNIIIALTNKCNLHCYMCNIWEELPKKDFNPKLMKRIFESKKLDKNVSITFTGGEPFLYPHLNKITKIITTKNPLALRTISTNGTLTKRILNYLKKYKKILPNLTLSISLDGINKNDLQRGTSRLRIMKTIEEAKKKFPNLKIKIKYTITPLNYDDILQTYAFCNKHNLKFKVKIAENAVNYTNKKRGWAPRWNKKMINTIINSLQQIASNDKEKKTKQFIKKTVELIKGHRNWDCKAPFERLFIMPNGTVYSCIHFKPIGNLNKEDLDQIWDSKNAKLNRIKLKQKKCKGCVSYHGNG